MTIFYVVYVVGNVDDWHLYLKINIKNLENEVKVDNDSGFIDVSD